MAGSAQTETARRQFEEVWSTGNLDVVDEILAEDFVRHGPDLEGGQINGREGFKGLVTLFRTGLLEIGDRVIVRWHLTGTNTGGALGQEPNGKRVNISGQHMQRFTGEQVAEEWVSYDALGLIQQLGLELPG